jgi:hypothetical protein
MKKRAWIYLVLAAFIANFLVGFTFNAKNLNTPFFFETANVYNNYPLVIDLFVIFLLLMGATKVAFGRTYSISARIGITLAVTLTAGTWEGISATSLVSFFNSDLLVIFFLLVASVFYGFLIYTNELGAIGTAGLSFCYLYMLLCIYIPESLSEVSMLPFYLNIVFLFSFIVSLGFLFVIMYNRLTYSEISEASGYIFGKGEKKKKIFRMQEKASGFELRVEKIRKDMETAIKDFNHKKKVLEEHEIDSLRFINTNLSELLSIIQDIEEAKGDEFIKKDKIPELEKHYHEFIKLVIMKLQEIIEDLRKERDYDEKDIEVIKRYLIKDEFEDKFSVYAETLEQLEASTEEMPVSEALALKEKIWAIKKLTANLSTDIEEFQSFVDEEKMDFNIDLEESKKQIKIITEIEEAIAKKEESEGIFTSDDISDLILLTDELTKSLEKKKISSEQEQKLLKDALELEQKELKILDEIKAIDESMEKE